MNTEIKLTEVFCDNFLNYYRIHSIHFNITGENFAANHKLLQKMYEDAQQAIDDLGELIRSMGAYAPMNITEILARADLGDDTTEEGWRYELELVLAGQHHMIDTYKDLDRIAGLEDESDIANYAQDRIRTHKKYAWMLQSILDN
jgi:starvation-inducible DNA-binding protein